MRRGKRRIMRRGGGKKGIKNESTKNKAQIIQFVQGPVL